MQKGWIAAIAVFLLFMVISQVGMHYMQSGSTAQKSLDYAAASSNNTIYNNNSNIVTQIFYEQGLPSNAYWTVNYFGANASALAGSAILFQVPFGTYSATFYDYTFTTQNATTNCTVTYLPANFIPDQPALITSGSSVTVNYNNYQKNCISTNSITGQANSSSQNGYDPTPVDWTPVIFAVLVLAFVISGVVVFLAVITILRSTRVVKKVVVKRPKRASRRKPKTKGGVTID